MALKRLFTSILVLAAFVLLAFLLNPSPERHRQKIKEAIAERSPIAGALGMGALTAFVSQYHSLGVASYTMAGDKRLSWGAFGIVFVEQ
jgi:hypothetical protein